MITCLATKLLRVAVIMAVVLPIPTVHAQQKKNEPVYDEQGWRLAVPGWHYSFPQDHGSHDEFQTEWWYFTGNVRDRISGRRFGYQLTFFRQGLISPKRLLEQKTPVSEWRLKNLYFAHFSLSDPAAKKFIHDERVSRAVFGLGFYSRDQFWAQIGNWYARAFPPLRRDATPRMEESFELHAETGEASIHLYCTRAKPAVYHGKDGVSQKAAGLGRATHYYSMTRLDTTGTIIIGGKKYDVEGLSWFDKEFGTNQLDENQVGWDWMSLQLDNGAELMVYGLRDVYGHYSEFSSGTYIDANGRAHHLTKSNFKMVPIRHWSSPVTGARYPVAWKLEIPVWGYSLDVRAAMDGCELNIRGTGTIDYWEGPVDVRGAKDNETICGHGFLEMTGYAQKLSTR